MQEETDNTQKGFNKLLALIFCYLILLIIYLLFDLKVNYFGILTKIHQPLKISVLFIYVFAIISISISGLSIILKKKEGRALTIIAVWLPLLVAYLAQLFVDFDQMVLNKYFSDISGFLTVSLLSAISTVFHQILFIIPAILITAYIIKSTKVKNTLVNETNKSVRKTIFILLLACFIIIIVYSIVSVSRINKYGDLTSTEINALSDYNKVIGLNNLSKCQDFDNVNLTNACIIRFATENKNFSICENSIENSWKDNCYSQVGAATLNISICEMIVQQGWKDQCFYSIAMNSHNQSVCTKINNTEWENICNINNREFNNF